MFSQLFSAMDLWLGLPDEEQELTEVRYVGGILQSRTAPLHEGIILVLSLDPYLSIGYSEIMFADWYREQPLGVPQPIGFSSVEDFKTMLWENPMLEMAQEAVLHWLSDEAMLESAVTFNPNGGWVVT